MTSKVFFLVLLLSLSILISCRQKKENPPVAQKKMSAIIVDLQAAEAYSLGLKDANDSVKVSRFDRNTDSLYVFYSSVLKHYGLTFQEFKDAISWYKAHPVAMDSMLHNSIDVLNLERAKLGISDSPDSSNAVNELQMAPGFSRAELKAQQFNLDRNKSKNKKEHFAQKEEQAKPKINQNRKHEVK